MTAVGFALGVERLWYRIFNFLFHRKTKQQGE